MTAGDTLPAGLITALFEVLSFPDLMDNLKLNQALEAALLHLKQSHELALTDGGRYQGLYRLMAHPSPQIRAMVRSFVSFLGFMFDVLGTCLGMMAAGFSSHVTCTSFCTNWCQPCTCSVRPLQHAARPALPVAHPTHPSSARVRIIYHSCQYLAVT